jgi:hypothetical protein
MKNIPSDEFIFNVTAPPLYPLPLSEGGKGRGYPLPQREGKPPLSIDKG